MTRNRQILLIEDNPGDAELIRAILARKQGSDFKLQVEDRLGTALAFLAANLHSVDIVLLDLGLPDSQGVASIEKIRSLYPFLPVVVITGNGDEQIGIEAVRKGAQDYIFKGLIPEHYLTQIIEYAIHRQESEYRLKQSEEKYRSIVENIGIGVAMIDRDRNIVEANAQLSNWFSELEPKPGTKCYHTIRCLCGGDPASARCPVNRTFEDGRSHREVSRLGSTTYRLLSSPLKDGNGRVKGVVLLMEDISERLSVEARLRQAQKMESLGTLAGGVAHDFNNILTAIQGFTTLARYEAEAGSRLMSDLSEILQASQRASDLVKQILTFSRMGECEKEPVRIDLIVKEALKLLRSTLPSSIEIKTRVEKVSDKIVADPTQIHQIMMNLCTNAAHAMQGGSGVLEVSLDKVGPDSIDRAGLMDSGDRPYLRLKVRDTGSGIPAELIESIFDPYFTTKGVGEGTGLGLSVVQGIVTDCGGEIQVSSIPGEGSCFSVYFPVSEKKAEVKSKDPLEGPSQESGTILMVDDEPAIREVGARLLEHFGYTVHTAANGYDALEFIRQNHGRVDLIVSDMTMPRMTGLDLADELSKQSFDIPIIIMTGYSRMLSLEKNDPLNVGAVIAKPISESNLVATVRKILAGRK